jgi:hypothetical protein
MISQPQASVSGPRGARSSLSTAKWMQSSAVLAPVVDGSLAGARKQNLPDKPARSSWSKPSAFSRVLRSAMALGGCFALVVSLVDPLRGSDRLDVTSAMQATGARHE